MSLREAPELFVMPAGCAALLVGILLFETFLPARADPSEHDRNCAEWTEMPSPWPLARCFRYSGTGAVVCREATEPTVECKP